MHTVNTATKFNRKTKHATLSTQLQNLIGKQNMPTHTKFNRKTVNTATKVNRKTKHTTLSTQLHKI